MRSRSTRARDARPEQPETPTMAAPTLSPSAQESDLDKVVAGIQKKGGKVDRDDKAPGKPVIAVNFATAKIDDEALDALKGLDQVTKVSLNGTPITDAGLERLKGLESLQKLYLVDCKVTDAGLE